MAIAGNLYKVVWGGMLAQTETWSCGVHLLSPTPWAISDTLIASGLSQWMGRASSAVNNLAKLEWLKINEIVPTTARYVDQNNPRTYFFPAPTSGAGGAGFTHMTLAVSTVTALTRGRSSKGRLFPPLGFTPITVDASGRIPAGVALSMATSASQLITDINGGADGSCVVFSKIGQLAQEITGTRVGRVADVQSRRRKGLVEDYQSVPIS